MLKNIVKYILDRIYEDEYNCIYCGKELNELNRYGLCDKCKQEFETNIDNRCFKCGKPIYDEAEYCMVCQNNERLFKANYSSLIYKGKVKKIISEYKFYNKLYLKKYLVSQLVDEYINQNLNVDLICCVPTYELDKKGARYHSYYLAKELAKRLKIDVNCNTLIKSKKTMHQAKLSGKERQDNLKGAFELIGNIENKKILIIDDILTTGATMNECAKVLKKGKPKSIECLTIANTEYKLYTA